MAASWQEVVGCPSLFSSVGFTWLLDACLLAFEKGSCLVELEMVWDQL